MEDSKAMMEVFTQNELCPSQVLFAFDDVVPDLLERVRWAVAYSTARGCQRLISRITERIGQADWDSSEKIFVTSLDWGMTDPSALQYLADQENSRVFVANADIVERQDFVPRRAYHPKMYLFDSEVETSFVVGSANLTENALVRNTEVVLAGNEVPVTGSWDSAWTAALLDATPLTTELLAAYSQLWRRPACREVEPDPALPRVRPSGAIGRRVFGDAVQDGAVRPMEYRHFWVESGSMSSGGSHNQLELPRGANSFFGFTFENYGDTHETIGYPCITMRRRRWTDRPLTWHGNNRMERLNLPTRRQGGFNYPYTAIMFRRHDDGFELQTAAWDDDEAGAWRSASETLGAVFRLGERGERICGLF